MLITTRITVIDYWEKYARDQCAGGVSAGRLAQYDSQMKKYILPELGCMELCRVTQEDIDRLLKRLSISCTPGTQGSVKALLYKLFHQAVMYGLRPDNPVEGSRKVHAVRSKAYRYTPQECRALLGAFQESELPGALKFQFFTGLSRGETYGLRAGGIDLFNNVIYVDQFYALDENRNPVILRTSRNYRRRRISIPERAAAVLMDELIVRDRKRRRAGSGWHNMHDLVFTESDGSPISDNTHLRTIRNVRKHCDYRGSRSLQDHFAMTAIWLGASAVDLHEYLGHRSFYPVERYLRSCERATGITIAEDCHGKILTFTEGELTDMPRRTKKQTAVLAEHSEETPLWKLLQQVKEQAEAAMTEDDVDTEIHTDPAIHADVELRTEAEMHEEAELHGEAETYEEAETHTEAEGYEEAELHADTDAKEAEMQSVTGQMEADENEVSDSTEILPAHENNEIAVATVDADGHSLTCYLSMLYAYCDLINKAMQQTFYISGHVITFMVKVSAKYRAEGETYSSQEFRKAVSVCLSDDPGSISGIRIEDTGIVFEAFSELEEDAYLESYRKFLQMLERTSHTCRLIQSRTVHESEKFDMYQLLQKIHAGGEDNRMMRKRMTERLGGHTAFADDAAKARWEKKHGKRKKVKTKRKK